MFSLSKIIKSAHPQHLTSLAFQKSYRFSALNPKSCFYEVLDLKPNAKDSDVKKAYLVMGIKPYLFSQDHI